MFYSCKPVVGDCQLLKFWIAYGNKIITNPVFQSKQIQFLRSFLCRPCGVIVGFIWTSIMGKCVLKNNQGKSQGNLSLLIRKLLSIKADDKQVQCFSFSIYIFYITEMSHFKSEIRFCIKLHKDMHKHTLFCKLLGISVKRIYLF